MADLSDVEAAMAALATSALYPDGITSPSAVGADCRIYRGWPTPAGLDADLKAGVVNVTVFPDAATGKTITPYSTEWQGSPVAPALIGTILGATVTFSGSADAGQLAGVRLGSQTFAYRTVAGDTPASVAANIAALIRVQQVVQLAGPTIVIPGAANIEVRVVADTTAIREIRRQIHDVRISFWCPTPQLRDLTSTAVDIALAATTFVALPDSSRGRVNYKSTSVFDQSQSAILYRRDLIYAVEYPTTVSAFLPAMLFGELAMGAVDVSV